MAGKSKVRNALRSAFGRVEKVNIRDSQGDIVRTIEDPDEFEYFVRENRDNITDFQHEIIPRNESSMKTTFESYRKSILRATGRSPSIILGEKMEELQPKGKKAGVLGKLKSHISPKKTAPAASASTIQPQIKKPLKIKTTLRGKQLKTFRKLQKQPYSKYLSTAELEFASSSDPVTRKLKLAKARRMYRDPAYRAKILSKREEGKGFYEAKLESTKRLSKRRMKAATSPWWRAWYGISHNLWVLLGVVLAIAILFLPIGMFHVLGWSLAVGIVSLVMFIVWIFIEGWWLIAQGMVAGINFIGQAIVGVINWIGGAFAGALGMSFTPFEHILVQNMNLVGTDAAGNRVILGMKWGEANLVPPSFLKLDEFMPTSFDTDTIIAKIIPGIRSLFTWYTQPIADRYTQWISEVPWYTVGAVIGIPIALIVLGIVAAAVYVRRKMI